ncbi:putative carbamoylphosphate synthase large subunit [Candidatus Nitrososphaera gargensis Ga9.2]|uniref:Putative carbamoylphosphate synthase large subunit n=1 Tax=Nitrososphaera gargensis (strain Ga9.2) TaxID=1237085 RepID=K0ID00_NITGG|nr:ATP-grasp domain-containing protein [Candidatus Nitrososphaera gargensis]AFU59251.1 putative carbamoylphosphate synthase large subunit [Candidatus Nitrososphaera gargensis Ga9.2]
MNARVLVTAAGSIVAQGIIKSLKLASKKGDIRYTIIAADMSPLAAGLYRCDSGILVPPVSSPDYIDSVAKVCSDNDVQAVFCGSDDELLALAGAKEAIEKTGAKLLTGPLEALAIARDKWATYEFCRANGLACAPSSLPEERDAFVREFGFPVVVKPREGYGSLHFYIAKSKQEMDSSILAIERAGWRPLVQKYLAGDEFTTGVTIDRNSTYAMSSISIRKMIKHGQTYKAFIDHYHSVCRSAEDVALKLGASGPINVQAKLEGEAPVVFEINPRFSATCPMRAAAGVNEPDIVFRNTVLGQEVKINSYERLVCMRYWNEVYVPYLVYEKALHGRRVEKGSFVPDYF